MNRIENAEIERLKEKKEALIYEFVGRCEEINDQISRLRKEVDQVFLDEALSRVKANQHRVDDIKSGKVEPTQCFTCACCRRSKVLTGAIKLSQMINQK